MSHIIVTEPENFPGSPQAELFHHLRLLIWIEPTPGAIDLNGRVDRMGTATLIGFTDIFETLLTDAGHPGPLLPNASPPVIVRIQWYYDSSKGTAVYRRPHTRAGA